MIAAPPKTLTNPTFLVDDERDEQPRLTIATDELAIAVGPALVRLRWSEEGLHVVVRSDGYDVELDDVAGDLRIGVAEPKLHVPSPAT